MSELLSSQNAKLAWANGENIQYQLPTNKDWVDIDDHCNIGVFNTSAIKLRLKPRTITINGIEVPAPFEPKLDDVVYYLTTTKNEGYTWGHFHPSDAQMTQFGAWRTEDEIRQVVAAIRSVFKPQ